MASGFTVIFRKGFPTLILSYSLKAHLCFPFVFSSLLFLFRFLIHLGFVWAFGGEGSDFHSQGWLHPTPIPMTEWPTCPPPTCTDTSRTLHFQFRSHPFPLSFPRPSSLPHHSDSYGFRTCSRIWPGDQSFPSLLSVRISLPLPDVSPS